MEDKILFVCFTLQDRNQREKILRILLEKENVSIVFGLKEPDPMQKEIFSTQIFCT